MRHVPQITLKTAPQHRLAMTHHLRQALAILQMPHIELEQWLIEEIQKNPLLELEMQPNKNGSIAIPPIAAAPSLHDHLMKQIRENFPNLEEQEIAKTILEEMDERGFITLPFEILTTEPIERIKKVLSKLQTFDPPGIFARDLQESLLLQLKAKSQEKTVAYQILQHHFDDFLKKKFRKIEKELGKVDWNQALQQIAHLNFRPASIFDQQVVSFVKADLSISKVGNTWIIETLQEDLPKFRLHEEYLSSPCASEEEKESLRTWNQSARSIIRALKRRHQLLLSIGAFLVRKQTPFLEQTGELKAITIQELARQLQLHTSTLSRALSGKYVLTARGFLSLRSLFSASSLKQRTKRILQKLIAQEDRSHPMTDEECVEKLKSVGLHLARRTIVKYRHEMNITGASRRKFSFEKTPDLFPYSSLD